MTACDDGWPDITERIVHRQVYKYLREHNLVTSEQFGFRPNLSTNVALTRVTEEILLNIDNKLLATGAVFIDEKSLTQLITPC
jgi:hypothetical protein